MGGGEIERGIQTNLHVAEKIGWRRGMKGLVLQPTGSNPIKEERENKKKT